MKKKGFAAFFAGFLGVAVFSANIYAAPAYQDTEKAALKEFVTDFITAYTAELDAYDIQLPRIRTKYTIELGDTGRSLIGMSLPADISWFRNASFDADLLYNEDIVGAILYLHVNDTPICTSEVYFDKGTQDFYIRIPELSESYIACDFDKLMLADPSGTAEPSEEDLMLGEIYSSIFSNIIDLPDFLPQPDSLENILDKYLTMCIESMEEGGSGTDVLNIADVSQECTFLEGFLTEEKAVLLAEEILTSVRNDPDILDSLTRIAKFYLWNDSDRVEEDLQKAIDSALSALSEDSGEDTEEESLVSKIWLNEKGQIIGRQFSIQYKDGRQEDFLTLQNSANGQERGFLFEMGAEDSSIAVTGSGTVNEGLLNGSYTVLANSQPVASIEVADYDTEFIQNGRLNGVYTLKMLPDMQSEDMVNPMLKNLSLKISFSSSQEYASTAYDYLIAGSSVFRTISETSLREEPAGEIPDFSDPDTIFYQFEEEEDLIRYTEEMDAANILDKLIEAGMPENFPEEVSELFFYDNSGYYGNSYYDGYGEYYYDPYDTPYGDSYDPYGNGYDPGSGTGSLYDDYLMDQTA